MGIFLRHSYNVKPSRWGSTADVQYAIKINAEKIYQVDPDNLVLAMPLFWGLSLLDYSGQNNHGTDSGVIYKDGSIFFDANNAYISIPQKVISGNTFSIFFREFSSGSDNKGYFLADSKDTSRLFLRRAAENALRYSGAIGAASFGVLPNNISREAWHHSVVTHTNAGVGNWYIDGILHETINGSNFAGLNNALYIGNRYDLLRDFLGYFDVVNIYDIVLTTDQIALFHDLPWALYQSVSRPVYFFQAAEGISIPVAMQNMRGGFNPIGMRGGFINAD